MCQIIHYRWDNCEAYSGQYHDPPKPFRAKQCSKSLGSKKCFDQIVMVTLSSAEDCGFCYWRIQRMRHLEERDRLIHRSTPPPTYDENNNHPRSSLQQSGQNESNSMDATPESSPKQGGSSNATSTASSIKDKVCNWLSKIRDQSEEPATWNMPSLCFIDAGFIRMDPWAADRHKLRLREEAAQAAAAETTRRENDEVAHPEFEICARSMKRLLSPFQKSHEPEDMRSVTIVDHGKPEIEWKRQLAPCCQRKTSAWVASDGCIPSRDTLEDRNRDDQCTSGW